MKKSLFFLYFISLFLFFSCENNISEEQLCTPNGINSQIVKYMKDYYLWYQHLPQKVDVTQFKTPYELLDFLKYKKNDHFSYIVKKKDNDNYYSGKYFGLGLGLKRDLEENVFVYLVYPKTPADEGGIKRGMQVLEINNLTINELDENTTYNSQHKKDKDFEAKTDWNSIYGKNEAGTPVKFKLKKVNGEIFETTIKRAEVHIKTVLKSSIIKQDNEKIGYIAFKAFITPSSDELDEAFAKFQKEGITKLVLDLRYNGGGLLSTAQHLASLINGTLVGKTFMELTFNDKHQDLNEKYKFKSLKNSIKTTDLAVITTRGTASASETIINGLAPFINVSTFGDTTYGKPVGMNPKNICEEWTVVPITFKLANETGYGDYFDGIEPTCEAQDDFKHDFGDPSETSLKEALYYLKHKTCSLKTAPIKRFYSLQLRGIYKLMDTF